MNTEINSKTVDKEWVIGPFSIRQDPYAEVNRKRIEASTELRDELGKSGYTPEKYVIRIKHHPLSHHDGGTIQGKTSAIITMKP